jgi:lactate dehydrogenase-like 2-hydroxyacid dehydrogenase
MHLASAIGMIVYTPDRQDQGTIRKPLNILLSNSDFFTLHLPDEEQSKKFLNKETIRRLKTGVMVINIGNRDFVDEKAINQALTTRKIDTYCFEAQSWGKSPLKGNEFAIMLKPFSSYTQQTIERNQEAMVDNIEYIARGIPYSKLEL